MVPWTCFRTTAGLRIAGRPYARMLEAPSPRREGAEAAVGGPYQPQQRVGGPYQPRSHDHAGRPLPVATPLGLAPSVECRVSTRGRGEKSEKYQS